MSTRRTRRKDAIYNGIALSAVGIISLLFAGIQGSEAARLETDRITTQGIVIRKFRDHRQQDEPSTMVRLVEVRYLNDLSPAIINSWQAETSSSPFDRSFHTEENLGSDRPSPPRMARESVDAISDEYQTLTIEILSASLFDRLQVGAVVDFSYRLSEPETARLAEEASIWHPPLWEYGVMGVTFGGAAYFFLKAIFMRREAAQRGRSSRMTKR
ncbi:MAG: hypothetical protein AAFY26_13655 [Cyanobacteria bacterium J06638_22]